MIDALIQAAQTEVDNHSIYVWGGSRRRDAGRSAGALAQKCALAAIKKPLEVSTIAE